MRGITDEEFESTRWQCKTCLVWWPKDVAHCAECAAYREKKAAQAKRKKIMRGLQAFAEKEGFFK
jgi:hypothetical protein